MEIIGCKDFNDIVAANALGRPGPMILGMHNKYAEGKKDPSSITYLHPKLEPILKKTYGVLCLSGDVEIYDLKTGKFEQFFDLGLNNAYSFGFYGDTIKVYYAWIGESFSYDLDEKDPLNRFGGLFDGFTYGDGRFVLICKITTDEEIRASYRRDVFIEVKMNENE